MDEKASILTINNFLEQRKTAQGVKSREENKVKG
jgi:hypothetical protein